TSGKNEKIEITVTRGVELEHGDYFILNQPNGQNYYFWFDNEAWVSNGDPSLTGRPGVAISYTYNDADTTIARKVEEALDSVLSNSFEISRSGDMLYLNANSNTEIPDPDDVTTSFVIDIAQQGESDIIGENLPMANERVYLIYGDGSFYNESARTGAFGDFQFDNLQVGEYQVYVMSKDPLTGEMTKQILEKVSITSEESIVETSTFFIEH
ncbi:MAG: hypothetical protein RL106_1415, partial [Bacteroidota bacterium]